MKIILDKYNFCNRFSLSGQRGFYKLSDKEADEIINITKKRNREECKKIWESINNKDKLPPFEEVIQDIEIEILNFGTDYIVDVVGEKTKYGREFWHIYSLLSNEIEQLELIRSLQKTEETGPYLIDTNRKYEILKPYIKRKEISFHTHCTISSILYETYYFELNEETKKWLLNYEDVFSFDGEPLEDLAFYKDEKLKFSSCTHEGYMVDKKEEE